VQGTVIIEALLDTSGKMGRARIVSKPSVLDAAALNAVLQWEFQPATRNGAPIAISMTTTVSFSMRR
jgi:protein TonB